MERFFIIYLLKQAISRISRFLKHWYVNGFLYFWQKLLRFLEILDRIFAVKITIRHWLQPLYQDRTVVGYTLGFIFRSGRILVGGFIYSLIFLVGCLLYLVWALIPPALILKIFY